VNQIKILLLRGVNVAGANRLPMPEFREMLAELGLGQVKTHIQSGNAVFVDPNIAGLTDKIKVAMMNRFGFAPPQFPLTLAEFEAIIRANPFATQAKADGAKVHVFFLSEPVDNTEATKYRAILAQGEDVMFTDHAVYLLAPNGIGRSVIAEKLDKSVKVRMTGRNYNSVASILALARGITA
jgi:uncharacterized protein (DUF1697 family)